MAKHRVRPFARITDGPVWWRPATPEALYQGAAAFPRPVLRGSDTRSVPLLHRHWAQITLRRVAQTTLAASMFVSSRRELCLRGMAFQLGISLAAIFIVVSRVVVSRQFCRGAGSGCRDVC